MKAKRHCIRRCRRFFLAALLVGALTPAGRVWATPVTRAERELESARARQQEAQREADSLKEKQEESEQQARELGDKLTGLLTLSSLLESDMKELEGQIGEADRAYEAAKKEQEQRYDMLKKRVRFLYEQGDVTYLDILLKSKSIGDMVNQTEYYDQLYRYDQDLLLQYEEIKAEVRGRLDKLEEKQSQMEVMKQEYKAQQTDIRQLIRSKEKETADFAVQLADARKRADRAADEVRKKNEEIRRLRAEEERRREQERARAEQELARRQGEPAGAGQEPAGAGREPAGTAPGNGISGTSGTGSAIKSSGGTAFGRSVADYGLQFVGNPYVYGGTSLTSGADCSGFVQSVYRHFGVSIPRTSAEQAHYGKEVGYGEMEPGDLVCYSGHVAMYIGNGQIVHASSRKEGIKVSNDPAYRTIVSIRRPWQ